MKFKKNWQEEKQSAYLYRVMSQYETHAKHQKLFKQLSEAAEKQANLWKTKILEENPTESFIYSPTLKTKIIKKLIIWLGPRHIPTILSVMKIRGMSIFREFHTEHKHLSINATSNIRAAIFGVNDGLVSNMSFILGIAGANANHHFIIVGGIACLLAGAASMGAGEYISVCTQRRMFQYQISLEAEELKEYPEEEIEELALIYEARGIPTPEAKKLAQILIQNPKTALNTLAREELGLNPDDLVSPYTAMIASFFAFAMGALIPILPFLFLNLTISLLVSIILTGSTLFLIGASLSFFTNRHPLFLGTQMLLVGAIAGISTYLIGWLLGVNV